MTTKVYKTTTRKKNFVSNKTQHAKNDYIGDVWNKKYVKQKY